MQFGVRSDTGDLTGVLGETGVTTTREAVDAVLAGFLGTVMQQVPMTSAVKVDGERLYKKAHRGEVVETPVKEVEISAIEILDFDEELIAAVRRPASVAREDGYSPAPWHRRLRPSTRHSVPPP